MKLRKSLLSILKKTSFVSLLVLSISCQESVPKSGVTISHSIGPKHGSLLIGGGGMTEEMWSFFYDLAGGASAELVVIPTAFDENSIDYDPEFKILKRQFEARGFRNIQFMHTRDTVTSNSDGFVKPL